MDDPLLLAHRQRSLVYAISGPSPISIRDQMLRGVMVVHRLIEAREIGADRPLVVVGAGAAGATAAMEAVRQGIPTVLADKTSGPFTLQSAATSRELHPTQYDWPAIHYDSATLQYNRQPLPLNFYPDRADMLSGAWTQELGAAQRNAPVPFDIHYDIADFKFFLLSRSLGGLPTSIGVMLQPTTGPQLSLQAGAVIQAFGIGSENCCCHGPNGVPYYEGQPFWGPDKFSSLQPSQHRVLISGSGDGALQDFLRIVTGGKRAIDILQSVESTGNLSNRMLLEIMSVEDEAHRGRSWAHDHNGALRQRHQHHYFENLEITHRNVVNRALSHPKIRNILHNILVNAPPIDIVYREPFITSYYGLNRFLTLLLAEYSLHHAPSPRQILYPGCTIAHITAAGSSHACMRPASAGRHRANGTYNSYGMLATHTCFGQDHQVTFNRAPSQQPMSLPTSAPPKTGIYNVIIIRHGLLPPQPPPPVFTRSNHLLPYGQT